MPEPAISPSAQTALLSLATHFTGLHIDHGNGVTEDVAATLRETVTALAGGAPWAPSWAKVAARPCVTVLCSHCRQDLDCDGEGGSWHYDDVASALKAALEYGWTSDVDRLLCKSCAEEIVCARDGHRWGDHHHSDGFTGYAGTVYLPDDWWECAVCEHTVHEQPEGWVPPLAPDTSAPTLLDGDPWAGDAS